ncbi:MAG: hypothetical protein WD872_17945 [Pirellulaceae bacterium]
MEIGLRERMANQAAKPGGFFILSLLRAAARCAMRKPAQNVVSSLVAIGWPISRTVEHEWTRVARDMRFSWRNALVKVILACGGTSCVALGIEPEWANPRAIQVRRKEKQHKMLLTAGPLAGRTDLGET